MTKDTLLVTGGAGFIGSNFIRLFLSKHPGTKVINFDKLTYCGNLNNLKGLNSRNYRFVRGDIAVRSDIEPVIREADGVINFAAESHVDRSISSSREFVRTNIDGVELLLSLARKHSIRRFLQISTDEVYGSTLRGSFTEKSPLKPSSPYSASKASADLLALACHTTFRQPVVITRSSNNYGPYQYPEKVIPLFITNGLRGLPLPLYGSGKNVRNWIHVLDNCAGIDLVYSKGADGEVYNLAGPDELDNITLAKRIVSLLGLDPSVITPVADRPGHDFRYSIDASKSEKLGFRRQTSLGAGLSSTVAWYSKNRWWWNPLIGRKSR